MGSWCETDGITQLAINYGDKVRVFVISSQNGYQFADGGAGGGGTCYSTDRWAPIGPALQGTYDDYGGVENIVMDENTNLVEDYIVKNWVPLVSTSEWDKIPEELGLSDYLHFIERDRGKIKPEFRKEQHLGLMFVHEDVYQAMINFDSIEAHHYLDRKEYEYMPFSHGIKLEFKEWYEKQIELFKLRESKDLEHLYELMGDMENGHLFSSYQETGLSILKKPLQACAREAMPFEHEKVQKIIISAMEMFRFQSAMSRARKQWMPQSGKGGRQNDPEIYQVINAACEKIINDRDTKEREENIMDESTMPDVNGYYPWQLEHNQTLQNKGADVKKGE